MVSLKRKMMQAGVVIFLLLSVVLFHAQAINLEKNEGSVMQSAGTTWTVLFYIDSDYSGSFADPLQDVFLDEIASTSTVNVVAIQDTLDGPGVIYYIDGDHSAVVLQELGEVNMGDYLVLQDFIMYGKEHYPADRYLLWVYDHGGAWKGACLDETDDSIGMTLDKFQVALTESGGVDVVCFLACLMGSVEVVYELRDCVDVVVGSEDLAYGSWFDDVCGETNELLSTSPEVSTEDLGAAIVQFFEESNNPPAYKLTMSALRTNTIESLADAIDALVRYYCLHWLQYYHVVKTALNNTFLLSDVDEWAKVFEVYDLRGFIENLPECSYTEAVIDAIDDVVIVEAHGSSMEGTHGLSIFFQSEVSSYGLFREYRHKNYGLDFSMDTFWNEFLFFLIVSNIVVRN